MYIFQTFWSSFFSVIATPPLVRTKAGLEFVVILSTKYRLCFLNCNTMADGNLVAKTSSRVKVRC
jgi:hypothetical protein